MNYLEPELTLLRIDKIVDGLYLSGHKPSQNRAMLQQHGITHVVNAANATEPGSGNEGFHVHVPCPWPDTFRYLTVYVDDATYEQIKDNFTRVLRFIDDAIQQSGRVLVHCQYGISRSASLVIAYLMWSQKISFLDAFRSVKSVRDIVQPNPGFVQQLYEFGAELERSAYNLSPIV